MPPPMFLCSSETDSVPYTLVCDFRSDCLDHSDEDFCIFPFCSAGDFACGSKLCIPSYQVCDGTKQCNNGIDEFSCELKEYEKELLKKRKHWTPLSPRLVEFNGLGNFTVTSLNLTTQGMVQCPDTHFLCPANNFYCLPVYVRCNDVYDCQGYEDELECDKYTCHGYYRCRFSHVCVHVSHLCDGLYQCPQYDDEAFCNLTCPENCTCFGYAFICTGAFPAELHRNLRFLDGRQSLLTFGDVRENNKLIYLNLANCELFNMKPPTISNLRHLDVSDNYLATLSSEDLSQVKQLHTLRLAGNPVTLQLTAYTSLPPLRLLDLSRVEMPQMNISSLALFPHLNTLNLSHTGLYRLLGEGFHTLPELRVLDLRGCGVTQLPGLQALRDLQRVFADNFKLCCPASLPDGFNVNNCHAPSDEISSCDALLRSNIYRILLAVFGVLALIGNLSIFLYRAACRKTNFTGFSVFVIHLCVSDFLMGVYLAVIGVADGMYGGSYLHKEEQWRHSAVCQMAGFLSFLSYEVSAFIICLITLDRFLALRFPFSHLCFQVVSAQLACAAVWAIGMALAALPLLPITSHWNYYSQTGICIPLPITRKGFGGQKYSFGIMIVLNFALFLLISIGQMVIYLTVQSNSMSFADSNRKNKNQTLARRLITVAVTDFLCWFPIGLLGLLASQDITIPSEVNVVMAVVVLPLNSTLNPNLYTLNLIQERRRLAKEERLRKLIMRQRDTASGNVSDRQRSLPTNSAEAVQLIKAVVEEKLVAAEQVMSVLKDLHF